MKNRININDYEGIIFDLDGTLVDSMWVWDYVDEEFLKKRNIKEPEDYKEVIMPMGIEKVADYTIKRFNLNENSDDIINEWLDLSYEAYKDKVKLNNGAYDFIKSLFKSGKKMSVATANDKELAKMCLENNKVYKYFNNITTVNEVERGKGFPDIYKKAADKMNINYDKCLVFEDIKEGITGSIKGGFTTVAVLCNITDESKKEEIKKISKYYIDDFSLLYV
ncbi:haloacid dehalogenase superfamily, subfamily IA, variant 3 with third motif having DD or ED [Lachnospiraceae bacterium RM5]|nr:haloacid dehalogenase superfamily, subfamily IA, variant 3 with third motif having DD or ED [Lachnospiraceae bacterium RM5]